MALYDTGIPDGNPFDGNPGVGQVRFRANLEVAATGHQHELRLHVRIQIVEVTGESVGLPHQQVE